MIFLSDMADVTADTSSSHEIINADLAFDKFVKDVVPPQKTMLENMQNLNARIYSPIWWKKVFSSGKSSGGESAGGPGGLKKIMKWSGIGCGGLFVLMIVISAIAAALGVK